MSLSTRVFFYSANLQQNGDATSKYQDLIIELELLERTLSRLYTLKPAEHELVRLEAIRAAASACKRPLESFMKKLEKFEKRLGTGNEKANRIKGAGRRIQFNVAFEEDVKEFRSTLASHVSTINTLLMIQTLYVTCFPQLATLNLLLAMSADNRTETQRSWQRQTARTATKT